MLPDQYRLAEYLTLDEYIEGFHAAIAQGQGEAYRHRYADVGVLLVDDVQFLTHRREMQAELLRLTNTMLTAGRQIVLSSDRPPNQISALDERLIQRFAGGLVIDISAPDYETRVAILRRQAEERKAAFDPSVLEAVATLPIGSIRELIGAFNRLVAYQAVQAAPITSTEARALLARSMFTGNYPPAASLEACDVQGEPRADTAWFALLDSVNLQGNSRHYHPLDAARRVSHVRVNLYPDGGLSRLRLYGRPDPRCVVPNDEGQIDLLAALNGGSVIAANNEHFGPAARLLLPGRGVNMGDGWETRRRREPGNDWCLIALAQPGLMERIEVDTAHFKGNYPDRCSLQAAHVRGGTSTSLTTQAMFWPSLMNEQPLQMDHVHSFQAEVLPHSTITHVRFNIHPDGGVSRLRLWGRVVGA